MALPGPWVEGAVEKLLHTRCSFKRQSPLLRAGFVRALRLLLQRGLKRRDHLWRIRRHGRLKASDRLSVARDEELGEVPLDLAANVGRGCEVLVERRLIVALYRDLCHHRKFHVKLGAAELFDLSIAAGLLVGEVV